MIIIVNYHTGETGDSITTENHLTLVSIRHHGATGRLIDRWKHVLEIEFADEARADSPV